MIITVRRVLLLALSAGITFQAEGRCEEMREGYGRFGFVFHLMDQNKYDIALLELERMIYLQPDSPDIPRARLLSGYCQMEAGRLGEALKTLEELATSATNAKISARALFLVAECLLRQGRLRDAEYYFRNLAEGDSDPQIRLASLYRLGWTKMRGNDWKEASRIFLSMDGEDGLASEARVIGLSVLKGDELPIKDPQIAGLLGGIVPGMGHAYLGRYRDAATAFILNAAFILASIEAFRDDKVALGGILGIMEVGWYAGNIYSAVNAAHKHNRKLRDDFRDNFTDNLKIRPLLSGRGLAAICLSFNY